MPEVPVEPVALGAGLPAGSVWDSIVVLMAAQSPCSERVHDRRNGRGRGGGRGWQMIYRVKRSHVESEEYGKGGEVWSHA